MSKRQLEAYLSRWQEWQSPLQRQPTMSEELAGGMTNRSFVITDGHSRYVLRLNHPRSRLLGVDRRQELFVHKLLHPMGLAPLVYFTDAQLMLREYVEGEILALADLGHPETMSQLKMVRDALHALDKPAGSQRFNYTRHLYRYHRRLADFGWSAAQLRDLATRIDGTAPSLDSGQWRPVVCHHDLIPQNIVMTRGGLVILDWEYAGWGHPLMDEIRLLGKPCGQRMASQAGLVAAVIRLLDEMWAYVQREAGSLPETGKPASG